MKIQLYVFFALWWFVGLVAASAQDQQKEYAEYVAKNNNLQIQLNNFYMLGRNPYMQDELEMTNKQKSDLRAANNRVRKRFSEFLTKFNAEKETIPKTEISRVYIRRQVEIRIKLVKEIENVFLDHQLERVRQIWKQQMLWRSYDVQTSPLQALMNQLHLPLRLAKEIGLDEVDQAHYRVEIDKIKKETQEKIERLYKQAIQDALGNLNASQRARLKNEIGDFYDFSLSSAKFMEQARKEAREKMKKSPQKSVEQKKK